MQILNSLFLQVHHSLSQHIIMRVLNFALKHHSLKSKAVYTDFWTFQKISLDWSELKSENNDIYKILNFLEI